MPRYPRARTGKPTSLHPQLMMYWYTFENAIPTDEMIMMRFCAVQYGVAPGSRGPRARRWSPRSSRARRTAPRSRTASPACRRSRPHENSILTIISKIRFLGCFESAQERMIDNRSIAARLDGWQVRWMASGGGVDKAREERVRRVHGTLRENSQAAASGQGGGLGPGGGRRRC